METALQVIWWIGLIVALGLTTALLKQVSLLLRVLRQIHLLSLYTRDAAAGLADGAAALEELETAGRAAADFAEATRALKDACASLGRRLQHYGKPKT